MARTTLAFFAAAMLFGGTSAVGANYVYLTFDDGPLEGTDDCIAVLADENVRATFLMVGVHMTTDFRKNQVKAVKSGGHLQGNHSNSHWHALSNYADVGKSNTQWLADFQACDAAIAAIRGEAGGKYAHARLPGKNCWRVGNLTIDDGNGARVADHLKSNGYLLFGWDVEWKYSDTAEESDPVGTPMEMADRVKNALVSQNGTRLPNKVIVLLHDHQFRTSRNNKTKLAQFIKKLKRGIPEVQFRTLDTYLSD